MAINFLKVAVVARKWNGRVIGGSALLVSLLVAIHFQITVKGATFFYLKALPASITLFGAWWLIRHLMTNGQTTKPYRVFVYAALVTPLMAPGAYWMIYKSSIGWLWYVTVLIYVVQGFIVRRAWLKHQNSSVNLAP
jgi:hypothetical protein